MASQDSVELSKKRRGEFLASVRLKVIRMQQPKTDGGKELCKELLEDDESLEKVMRELPRMKFISETRTSLFPNSEQWKSNDQDEANAILLKLKEVKQDKDKLWEDMVCGDVNMNGSREALEHYRKRGFEQSAAAWSTIANRNHSVTSPGSSSPCTSMNWNETGPKSSPKSTLKHSP